MSHENYRNKLQEYYQKQQLSLPVYTVECINGEGTHQPEFQAKIYTEDIKDLYGPITSSKSSAMMGVAQKAWEILHKSANIEIKSTKYTKSKYIIVNHYMDVIQQLSEYKFKIIDLDNSSNKIFEFEEEVQNIGIGTGNNIMDFVEKNKNKFTHNIDTILCLLPATGHKDLADINITLLCDYLISVGVEDIKLVSNDHFVNVLVEVLSRHKHSDGRPYVHL